jgi:ribosomal protein S1
VTTADRFLATVNVGDVLTGTVVEHGRRGTIVRLDGCPGEPLGCIGPLDLTWGSWPGACIVGERVAAEVIDVSHLRRRIMLSRSATENPQLWTFLKGLAAGQLLSGTVAAVERFGVFVDLDEGPRHPVLPGVGFVTYPELSWRRFSDPAEVVTVGQRVTGEFLVFDQVHGEARLSLRAAEPDPFLHFARVTGVGQRLHGRVTVLLPFGFFVDVGDGVEGFVRAMEHTVRPGDELIVAVAAIETVGRRLTLRRCG